MVSDGWPVAGRRVFKPLAIPIRYAIQVSAGFEERSVCAGLTRPSAYEYPFISGRPRIADAGAATVAEPGLLVSAPARDQLDRTIGVRPSSLFLTRTFRQGRPAKLR